MDNGDYKPNPVRLLLVDDVPEEVERVLSGCLELAPFGVTMQTADSVETFVASLEWKPDVILCTDVLRNFDAIQAAEALTWRGLQIPLLVLTVARTAERVTAF